MRKFQFSLADVYGIKRDQNKKIEDELMNLLKSFDNIIDRIHAVDAQIGEYDAKMREMGVKGATVSDLQQVRMMVTALEEKKRALEAEKTRMEVVLESLRQQHLRMKRELEVLDQIREEEAAEYAKDEEREQEKEVEGFMSFGSHAKRVALAQG